MMSYFCEVNWWRFATLFKWNWTSRYEKLSASARSEISN